MGILEQFESVHSEMRIAKQKAPHQRTVKLVAVSKKQPVSRIRELQEGLQESGDGEVVLGENYVQEYGEKKNHLLPHQSHLIGALQTNKARDAVRLFDWIESVHSEKLAAALEKEALRQGKSLPILLQVNISADPGKAGLTPAQFSHLVSGWGQHFSGLKLFGAMTITAFREDPEEARPDFKRLYGLVEETYATNPKSFSGGSPEISMGMSADYGIAIEEGATIVRVGSAIFGARA